MLRVEAMPERTRRPPGAGALRVAVALTEQPSQAVASACSDTSSASFLARVASRTAYSASAIAE